MARRAHENPANIVDNEIHVNIEEELRNIDVIMHDLDNTDFRVMNWKNDPGEQSRRIFEWWREIMNGYNTKLPFFTKALRLVITVQLPSTASERVFSQLNFIRSVVVDKILEDLLELRCLVRCKNGLENNHLANNN